MTPTWNRNSFLVQMHRIVLAQDYPEWEWLISDDSPESSAFFESLNDERIRYVHSDSRLSIGEKRNRMARESRGEIFVHFDDDDFYAPNYLTTMVGRLDREFDFVKLSGWYLYSSRYRWFGYWDCTETLGPHYIWSSADPQIFHADESNNQALRDNYLGFGFSYAYRRAVWEARPFDDVNWNEEGPLALEARRNFRLDHFQDQDGLCLHILHQTNTTRCFPQYVLPPFLIDRIFGKLAWETIGLRPSES